MPNYGIPFETTTDELRAFRATVGDTNYETVTPPVGHPEWTADYAMFSDVEAEAFIAQGEDSVLRAAGWAYYALAAQAALQSSSIRDYDLAVDTKNRSSDLLRIAQGFFDQADEVDNEDAFEIVPMGTSRCSVHREASPYRVGQHRMGICTCGGR